LAYIFQGIDLRGSWLEFLAPVANETAQAGLNYSVGVAIVGAVITLNVSLGGMKGITLVQAFQYWLKVFAITIPVFVLIAIVGHYNTHLAANKTAQETVAATPAGIERKAFPPDTKAP
jgi:Na+(H+)/acetate symporter ActP